MVPQSSNKTQQRGSALIFSLVIMTVITVGAMVAMQRTTLQARMISNLDHGQEVFRATYSTSRSFLAEIDEPGEYQIAADTLGDLILQENASFAQGNPYGLIRLDPFRTNSITRPGYGKAIKAVSINVRMLKEPNLHSAKENKDNSQGGAKFKYYMEANAEGVTNGDVLKSRQQQGFYLIAVSPNQQ
jgi:hypothetical protein